MNLLELEPHEVLSHYPSLLRGIHVFLGNNGGFSGARLWRLDSGNASFCLKAWSLAWRSPQELAWIHGLMTQGAALPWMPRVVPTTAGTTFVESQGRLWDLVTWMPGQADFWQARSPARLRAACIALGQLHQAWAPKKEKHGICPAVLRRYDSWRSWQQLVQTGWHPTISASDPYGPIAEQLWQLVLRRIDEVRRLLAWWSQREIPIQPCVCDLWHDHVLFTADTITGLIDFGSVKEDHVAVDLARLLGSLVGDDAALWHVGFDAYGQIRPVGMEERALAHDLDRTGTILSATNWLRWLYHERRTYPCPAAVVSRLTTLAGRLDQPHSPP
jgi:Ser/Thr protein kinase RdoA (MazF antagonist)